MLECFAGYLMAEHLYGETYVPPTGAFGHTTTITPYRQPFKTKDGWLMVQPASREQAARFMALGGLPDAYESERFVNAEGSKGKVAVYNEMMAEATATRTTAEWMELGPKHSIPLMVAHRARDMLTDPQLSQTLIEERELPGQGTYRALKPPLRFAKTPASIRRDPPEIGAHNSEVFAEFGIEEEAASLP
jgi:crotonobetainyl-CoA:carnitine CoA-transferase CaiB-like acyl-CoA transferase